MGMYWVGVGGHDYLRGIWWEEKDLTNRLIEKMRRSDDYLARFFQVEWLSCKILAHQMAILQVDWLSISGKVVAGRGSNGKDPPFWTNLGCEVWRFSTTIIRWKDEPVIHTHYATTSQQIDECQKQDEYLIRAFTFLLYIDTRHEEVQKGAQNCARDQECRHYFALGSGEKHVFKSRHVYAFARVVSVSAFVKRVVFEGHVCICDCS